MNSSVYWSEAQTDNFLTQLKSSGFTSSSVERYAKSLEHLRNFIPSNHLIKPDTLENWQSHLLAEGYSPRTVNTSLSAANTFLEYYGLEQFQYRNTVIAEKKETDITREDYQKLVAAAERTGNERAGLLIKLFANLDLQVKDIENITAKAVKAGEIEILKNKETKQIRIIEPLRTELADFAERNGLFGKLFITKSGTPLNRCNITQMITDLCEEAGVEKEKANPQSLRKLYKKTRQELENNLDRLVEMGLEKMMEEELELSF